MHLERFIKQHKCCRCNEEASKFVFEERDAVFLCRFHYYQEMSNREYGGKNTPGEHYVCPRAKDV